MKITDYAPRAAPFDAHLVGRDLVGVEVGVDVGAHAEALLTYCPVAMLYLVDPWSQPYAHGFCVGRLARFRSRITRLQCKSLEGAKKIDEMGGDKLDFVYLDQEHDFAAVSADLRAWWPLLRAGGVLGHRNYAEGRGSPLDRAIEQFVSEHRIRTTVESYLNDIILHK